MDIHQLETFLAVAEEKGFSRAANRLHRTQPAVSQVVRKLESDLGEVLFERSARRRRNPHRCGRGAVRLRAQNVEPQGGSSQRNG